MVNSTIIYALVLKSEGKTIAFGRNKKKRNMFYLEIGLGEIQKSKENPKRNNDDQHTKKNKKQELNSPNNNWIQPSWLVFITDALKLHRYVKLYLWYESYHMKRIAYNSLENNPPLPTPLNPSCEYCHCGCVCFHFFNSSCLLLSRFRILHREVTESVYLSNCLEA